MWEQGKLESRGRLDGPIMTGWSMSDLERHALVHESSGLEPQANQAVSDIEGFNSHLNMEQTSKALITLMEIYDKLHFEGRPSRNEPEFRAYQLLVRLHLGIYDI